MKVIEQLPTQDDEACKTSTVQESRDIGSTTARSKPAVRGKLKLTYRNIERIKVECL